MPRGAYIHTQRYSVPVDELPIIVSEAYSGIGVILNVCSRVVSSSRCSAWYTDYFVTCQQHQRDISARVRCWCTSDGVPYLDFEPHVIQTLADIWHERGEAVAC